MILKTNQLYYLPDDSAETRHFQRKAREIDLQHSGQEEQVSLPGGGGTVRPEERKGPH